MTRWTIIATLTASLTLPVLACSGSVASDPGPAAATDALATRAPVAVGAHGRVKRIGDALGQVGLRPDQRVRLEALAADAETRQVAVLAARQDLAVAIAEQVAGGAVDRVALAPKMSAMVEALSAAQPKDRAAFEAVHEILDPAQRAELAQAMQSEAHGGHLDHLKGMMNSFGDPGRQWADDLKLSSEQRAAFEGIVHESFAGHHGANGDGAHPFFHGGAHGKALLEAFTGDSFSFDDVSPAQDVGAKASGMTAHLLDVAEKVLPLLTPEQRTLAADKIRERAERLPLMPPM